MRGATARQPFVGRAALNIATATCLTLGLAGMAHAQAQPAGLKIIGLAKLTLDPVCNARILIGIDSSLRNDGSAPVTLDLRPGQPVNKSTGKVGLGAVTAVALDERGRHKTFLAPSEVANLRMRSAQPRWTSAPGTSRSATGRRPWDPWPWPARRPAPE